ncbi:MAG: hypothetical protein M3460_22605, partial [Actinomycetota bacterium]|nr:hypothetical protein [Actinomycetota bacterium]
MSQTPLLWERSGNGGAPAAALPPDDQHPVAPCCRGEGDGDPLGEPRRVSAFAVPPPRTPGRAR